MPDSKFDLNCGIIEIIQRVSIRLSEQEQNNRPASNSMRGLAIKACEEAGIDRYELLAECFGYSTSNSLTQGQAKAVRRILKRYVETRRI